MLFIIKNLILLLFILQVQGKLVQVVSLFRHGARYTLNSYYDGNQTRYIWGELTSVGMRQHQTLGQILKKQYVDKLGFLSPIYNRNQIEVYSTAVNRTVQSVISQLYGLYSLGTGPKILPVDPQFYLPPFSNKSDISQKSFALPNGHQIIPIKFDQKIMMNSCQNQAIQAKKNIQRQLDQYNSMNMTYYPFIRRMATMFNMSGNVTLETLASLNGNLDCDRYLNRPLPKQFNQEDQKNLRHIDSWYKQFIFVGDLAKAMNKDRLKKILSVFNSRINNPNQALKWTFLSGHDNDISAMYADLNLSSSQCIQQLYRKNKTDALNCQPYPIFAASLIFQLHLQEGIYKIKIRSNGKYTNLCSKKQEQCVYQDWKKRIVANLATDAMAQEICGVKNLFQQKQHIKKDDDYVSFGSRFRIKPAIIQQI